MDSYTVVLRVPRDTPSTDVNKLIEEIKENWMPPRWELLGAVKSTDDKEQSEGQAEDNSPMKATSQDKSAIVAPRPDGAGSSWEGSETDESLDDITLSPVLSYSPEYPPEYPASPTPQASSPTPPTTPEVVFPTPRTIVYRPVSLRAVSSRPAAPLLIEQCSSDEESQRPKKKKRKVTKVQWTIASVVSTLRVFIDSLKAVKDEHFGQMSGVVPTEVLATDLTTSIAIVNRVLKMSKAIDRLQCFHLGRAYWRWSLDHDRDPLKKGYLDFKNMLKAQQEKNLAGMEGLTEKVKIGIVLVLLNQWVNEGQQQVKIALPDGGKLDSLSRLLSGVQGVSEDVLSGAKIVLQNELQAAYNKI